MPRDVKLYLLDMQTAACNILKYVDGLNLEEFSANQMIVDAVVRNFEIIGEAAKHIPEDMASRYPSAQWSKLVGFRNILAHEYFGVDEEILWDAIKNKLPELASVVSVMLDQEH